MYRSAKNRVRRAAGTVAVSAAALAVGTAAALGVMSLHGRPSARSTTAVAAHPSHLSPTVTATAVPKSIAPVALTSSVVTVTPTLVVGLSPSSLRVQEASGRVVTYALTPATTVFEGRATVTRRSLTLGQRVFVIPVPASPGTARSIGILPAVSSDDSGEGGDN